MDKWSTDWIIKRIEQPSSYGQRLLIRVVGGIVILVIVLLLYLFGYL